jgi:hypothetical protein
VNFIRVRRGGGSPFLSYHSPPYCNNCPAFQKQTASLLDVSVVLYGTDQQSRLFHLQMRLHSLFPASLAWSGPLNEGCKGASFPKSPSPASWPEMRPKETFMPPTTSNLLPTIIIRFITEAKTSSPPLALFGVENAYPHQPTDVAVLTGQ